MFSDPQFWVAAAFIVFIIAVFNPIRKTLKNSLDSKITEIKLNFKLSNISFDSLKTK